MSPHGKHQAPVALHNIEGASAGLHVGNLKRIGDIWKFKAIGYDPDGDVMPGGGPLTQHHNMIFSTLDEAEVGTRLSTD